MKYLFFILLMVFMLACQSDTQTKPPPPIATNEAPETPPAPDREQLAWSAFWTAFKTAVANDDKEKVAELTVFPLHGMEHKAGGKPMTKAAFIESYDQIVDKEMKETVAKTSENMGDFAVKKQKTADRLHVPVNTKIRSISVLYIHNKGTDQQTESSVIYHFAKINGNYRLVSTMLAG